MPSLLLSGRRAQVGFRLQFSLKRIGALPLESTGTSFTFWTGDMVYKPLAVRVALIPGFRRALPVFRYMIVVAVAVVMWESPQGFPRGGGKGGKPALWLSMLSMPRHFHGLFLAKSRFSASIEREVDEAEEVSDVVFPSGDEPPEVVHPPRPSVRGSVSGVLPSTHSELPRASPEWHGCYCECCSQTSWKRHSKKCVANRSEENRSILILTDRKTTKSLPFYGGRRMDPLFQADALIGIGRGALISAMFGAGWLGWGLGNAKAFNALVGPTFGFTALFLFACSIYFIRKGRLLRKQCPEAGASKRHSVLKWYLLVVLMEVLAIALVAILANRLHHADLATDWCAMIVGLHFLPLAKIFRAPQLGVLGIMMILWCVLSWVLFQSSAIAIAASLGTGTLLWGNCVTSLFRVGRITRSAST